MICFERAISIIECIMGKILNDMLLEYIDRMIDQETEHVFFCGF